MATWLVDQSVQKEIARYIQLACDKVVARMDAHGDEDGFTAALGQELTRDDHFIAHGTRISLSYRRQNRKSEEPQTGGDGAFLVRVGSPEKNIVKAILFQSKKMPKVAPVESLRLPQAEASRLKAQADLMDRITPEAVALYYTRRGVYVVDAEVVVDTGVRALMSPLGPGTRKLSLPTYLGEWVPRCTRGDQRTGIVTALMTPGAKIPRRRSARRPTHELRLDVETRLPPQLVQPEEESWQDRLRKWEASHPSDEGDE